MGKPFEKHCRFFVLPVATVLADQKAPIRTSALHVLSAIVDACEGLEPMVPGIATALETSNPLQKGNLLQWLVEWFKEHEPVSSLDLSSWAASIVSCLDDRNVEVRKGAQAMLPALILCAGFDYVMQQTNSLKPASRASAGPLIQAARPSAPPPAAVSQSVKSTTKGAASTAMSPAPPASPPPDSPPAAPVPASKSGSKLMGVRRKLPQGTTRPESRAETPVEPSSRVAKPATGSLRRPGTTAPSSKVNSGQTTPSQSLPFSGTNLETRKLRLGKDSAKWINESGPTRKDLAELLQSQMEPHTAKDLLGRLFSHDHNAVSDHVHGLTTISELYTNALDGDETVVAVCLANLDLPLKYASIKAHEPQPNLISKCLEVVEAVLTFLRSVNYQLTDNEALCFVPTMIFKVSISSHYSCWSILIIRLKLGDAREPVRVRVQHIVQSLSKVYAYSRVFQLLLEHGLKSKVAKTRQGALDEMGGILKKSGMGACEPAKAFPAMAAMINDKDSSVRKSALGALRFVS